MSEASADRQGRDPAPAVTRSMAILGLLAEATGPHGEWATLPDARGTEWVSLVFLSAIIILFGLVPKLALSRIDPAIVALLDRIGVLP